MKKRKLIDNIPGREMLENNSLHHIRDNDLERNKIVIDDLVLNICTYCGRVLTPLICFSDDICTDCYTNTFGKICKNCGDKTCAYEDKVLSIICENCYDFENTDCETLEHDLRLLFFDDEISRLNKIHAEAIRNINNLDREIVLHRDAVNHYIVPNDKVEEFFYLFNSGKYSHKDMIIKLFGGEYNLCNRVATLQNLIVNNKLCSKTLKEWETKIRNGESIILDTPINKSIEMFIKTCIKLNPNKRIKPKLLYDKYVTLCKNKRYERLTFRNFSIALLEVLEDEGVTKSKSDGYILYKGVTLKNE